MTRTHWLVFDRTDVGFLVRDGVPRGHIWLIEELESLRDLPCREQALQDAVALKEVANGPLVEAVRDTGDETDG